MTETLEMWGGFICGALSGWLQVWVMQPFDMIKLRLINQCIDKPKYEGIIDCFKTIVKE